ncbi:hypothetical protein DYBT9275_02996 [Dyadobacter sp. CECT 9275]|uniref:Uncharacterized protein n=1 Tax=Dyadobacter helix TaxID=2822344 RepID=A0A916JCM7_9BACT|nr:hypothetical protein DYBT9275_02996 [Dyadobacter sp. CECT 9275]
MFSVLEICPPLFKTEEKLLLELNQKNKAGAYLLAFYAPGTGWVIQMRNPGNDPGRARKLYFLSA